jgi:hypothetical protein
VVSFLVFQGWMNVRQHRLLVTQKFEKRGRALASNLGSTSELGVFSEDKQLLEVGIKGALRDPDVAYVVIQGETGKVLASGGRLVDVAEPLGDVVRDQPLSRNIERAGQRLIEFVSPIVSEQAQTADEFLIGARGGPGREGRRANLIGGVRLGLSLAGVEEQARGMAKLWSGVTRASPTLTALSAARPRGGQSTAHEVTAAGRCLGCRWPSSGRAPGGMNRILRASAADGSRRR